MKTTDFNIKPYDKNEIVNYSVEMPKLHVYNKLEYDI
jgi:hypothetical protein